MDKLQVADFRANFREVTAPADVFRFKKRVGTWYPDGTAPNSADAAACVAYENEIAYLKRELAARLTTKVPDIAPTNVHAPKTAVRAEAKPRAFIPGTGYSKERQLAHNPKGT